MKDISRTGLASRLIGLLRGVGARGPVESEALRLVLRWDEPHRHYHTLEHLSNCLDALDKFDANRHPIDPLNLVSVELAIFWHDAVYVAKKDAANEADSAIEFGRVCAALEISLEINQAVGRLILATRHKEEPKGASEALIMDIDLLELASSAETYGLNSKNVRKEYAAYSDQEFAAGRLAFLTEFLKHPIYHSKYYSHLEDAARENMKRELGQCKVTIARPLSYTLLRTRNLDLASGSTESQRLGALVGKTIDHVLWHNSHGDVLEIVFTDGTRLCTCTFAGAETKYLNPDINDLYVSFNGQEL